ncbi:hypothetical protein OIO90_004233 [Microbotryomycetes sp. JL221]|nr:hypothetical protein OIO90_004233 [Microbotryomycetes sp. JL221]
MSFPMNQLPAEFEQEHGSVDLLGDDTKPSMNGEGDGDDGVEDEDLDVNKARQGVWLCKIPKFLMEKWSTVEQQGQVLGRIRVYEELDADGQNKVALILDNNEEPAASTDSDTKPLIKTESTPSRLGASSSTRGGNSAAIATKRGVPTEYKLSIQNRSSKNLYVFGEKEEEDEDSGDIGFRRKRHTTGRTALIGTVHHECGLTPVLGASYSGIMRERLRKASEPVRKIKPLDVDQATANRLASGMGVHGIKGKITQSSFVKTKQQQKQDASSKAGVSAGDRIQPRLPKTELMDLLFQHFEQAPYWHIRSLSERLKQPQTWLREVLTQVAEVVPRGPYNGMWKLKAGFSANGGTVPGSSETKPEVVPADDDDGTTRDEKPSVGRDNNKRDDDEDDDDEDEEMVVVE